MQDKSVKAKNIITTYGGTWPNVLTQREFAYWMVVEAVKSKNNK